eukprot:COSAG01_NODE_2773_length_7101_cov_5.678806_1_plen_59_part_00
MVMGAPRRHTATLSLLTPKSSHFNHDFGHPQQQSKQTDCRTGNLLPYRRTVLLLAVQY